MKGRSIALGLVGVAVVAGGGVAGYQVYIEQQAEQRIAEAVRELPPAVKVEYGKVDVGFLGKDLKVNDVKLTLEGGTPIQVDQVQVLELDRRNDPPNYLHAKAVGIRQDLTQVQDEQAATLRKLGYEEMRGSYELKYRYDPQTKAFDLQRLRGDLAGIGSVALQLKLDDFELRNPEAAAANQLPEFKVREVKFSYSDDSLVSRVIKQGAAERGISEEEFLAQLEQDIDAQTSALEGPFFKQLAQALKAFVREPGTLTLSAAPPEAVPVMEIMASAMIRAADLPRELNLTVKAGR